MWLLSWVWTEGCIVELIMSELDDDYCSDIDWASERASKFNVRPRVFCQVFQCTDLKWLKIRESPFLFFVVVHLGDGVSTTPFEIYTAFKWQTTCLLSGFQSVQIFKAVEKWNRPPFLLLFSLVSWWWCLNNSSWNFQFTHVIFTHVYIVTNMTLWVCTGAFWQM